MNISAVRHRSTGSDCYALDENTVVLNLHTDFDVERAYVVSDDPFIHELRRQREWKGKRREMEREYELEHTQVWTVSLTPEFKRLQYYFIVESGGEQYGVFENKICLIAERDRISTEYFKFPWINPSDVIAPPRWVRDTVWYQIFPDRFCRGEGFENKGKFREWGDFSNPHFNDLYGGDLRGITSRLPYLKEMGINGVYLTPIFLSNSNHKYNTFDYYTVDPDFGTEADLTEMVQTAHALGIRVMLDAVFNHCGTEFFAWKDVCSNGKASKYYDWFFINGDDFAREDFSTADGRFYSFSFWAGMPKLNTNNPEVQKYFTDLCLHWARDYRIDGIRFDVGDEIAHSFLRRLRTALKQENPDFFLLGEIWFDSITWLAGDEYDSVMDYPFTGALNDFWRDKTMDCRSLMHRLNFCRSLYPKQINEVMFNFLDTHDTSRVRETCENDDVLLQKLAMLMTFSGSPCLYYGTEIAMRGKYSPYNRSCMPWDEIDSGKYDGFRAKVAALVQLRRRCADLKNDELKFIFDDAQPRLVHFIKGNVEVFVNAGKTAAKPEPDGKAAFSNLYDGKTLQPGGVLISTR